MSQRVTRRTMLGGLVWLPVAGSGAALARGGTGGAGVPAAGYGDTPGGLASVPAEFPRQSLDLVREVVGAAHGNFERVRELVEATPALANATWDWGFGDWETALGAAAHTGRRQIAEYLLSRGARSCLFSAAMLGQLDVVRAQLAAMPEALHVRGPHGIPLLEHARAGGDPAAATLRYLESLPGATPERPRQLTAEQSAPYLGRYAYGPAPDEVLEVLMQGEWLAVRRADGVARRLTRIGEHRFHPAGAPAVEIALELRDGRAVTLTVRDGALTVRGARVG